MATKHPKVSVFQNAFPKSTWPLSRSRPANLPVAMAVGVNTASAEKASEDDGVYAVPLHAALPLLRRAQMAPSLKLKACVDVLSADGETGGSKGGMSDTTPQQNTVPLVAAPHVDCTPAYT